VVSHSTTQTPTTGSSLASGFIAGEENVLVDAAVRELLTQFSGEETPDCNPVVFCGPTGTGKSHVARSVLNQWGQSAHAGKVARNGQVSGEAGGKVSGRAARRLEDIPADVSAEIIATTGADFARSFSFALETKGLEEFRDRMTDASFLLIDDLHELTGKAPAQEELSRLIDQRQATGGRMLFTTRISPAEEPAAGKTALTTPLRSRLCGGLVIPFEPPAATTRQVMFEHLAEVHEIHLPADGAARLAAGVEGCWPQLNAALLQLRHSATSTQQPLPASPAKITGDTLQQFLREHTGRPEIPLAAISRFVCKRMRVKSAELKGATRKQHIVLARGVAMYLARQLTGKSYQQIGRHFGNRDHTTVMHNCRKTAELLETEPTLRQVVEEASNEL